MQHHQQQIKLSPTCFYEPNLFTLLLKIEYQHPKDITIPETTPVSLSEIKNASLFLNNSYDFEEHTLPRQKMCKGFFFRFDNISQVSQTIEHALMKVAIQSPEELQASSQNQCRFPKKTSLLTK